MQVGAQAPMMQVGGAAPNSVMLLHGPGFCDRFVGWLGQGMTSMGQGMAARSAPRLVMSTAMSPTVMQFPAGQQVQMVGAPQQPQQQVQYAPPPPPQVTASPQSGHGHRFGLGLFHHND